MKHRIWTCLFLAIFVTFSSNIVHVHSECRGSNSCSYCMMDPVASSSTLRDADASINFLYHAPVCVTDLCRVPAFAIM
jgi:hypothetical protein